MTYQDGHKPTLEFPEMMHVRHYREVVARRGLGFGCACRGCMVAEARRAELQVPIAAAILSDFRYAWSSKV